MYYYSVSLGQQLRELIHSDDPQFPLFIAENFLQPIGYIDFQAQVLVLNDFCGMVVLKAELNVNVKQCRRDLLVFNDRQNQVKLCVSGACDAFFKHRVTLHRRCKAGFVFFISQLSRKNKNKPV